MLIALVLFYFDLDVGQVLGRIVVLGDEDAPIYFARLGGLVVADADVAASGPEGMDTEEMAAESGALIFIILIVAIEEGPIFSLTLSSLYEICVPHKGVACRDPTKIAFVLTTLVGEKYWERERIKKGAAPKTWSGAKVSTANC